MKQLTPHANGRFPANLLVSDNVLGENSKYFSLDLWKSNLPFMHVAKPSKSEKNKGLEKLPEQLSGGMRKHGFVDGKKVYNQNFHPTVKPIKIFEYLITLGSREGDTVLDPFVGSGTSCIAAKQLKRNYIGIELSKEYAKIAKKRLNSLS